jgi:hypothetical protein
MSLRAPVLGWFYVGAMLGCLLLAVQSLWTTAHHRQAIADCRTQADSILAAAGRGLRVTLPDGSVAWIAPRDSIRR